MCFINFFEIRFVDLLLPILTIVALVIAYYQLLDIREHKRIEFTYQLYRDFFNYLNETENKELKDWLFGTEVKNLDRNKIGDLLEQFEAVWSLQNKNLIEEDVVYDLFSFYILKAAEAKNPSALQYLEQVRIEEKGLVGYADDLFIGYEYLFQIMKDKKNIAKGNATNIAMQYPKKKHKKK
jgi:hypothetical protein